ncbi:MAG: DNA polymerase III subunit alpha, partial [Deltaproteobacteria bacterium]|nr:DNA polymerase III subunit alpha [Deltaproteobacteria bacterium]
GDVAELGLWCVDLLPRPDLDRLADAEARARAADPAFDENATPLDDPAVLRAVCEGPALDSTALGDRGFRDLLRRLQPGRFTDLVAAWSLWRDPVDAGMVDALVERRHGRVPADPPVPCLGPHLGETYGLLLYQEQVIRVAREVAGLAAEEAAGMRRGLATRNPTEVARCRAAFVSGAAGRGVPEPEACAAFDLLEARTAAAFCKGHAACETLLAWRFARAGTQRAATRTKPFPRA